MCGVRCLYDESETKHGGNGLPNLNAPPATIAWQNNSSLTTDKKKPASTAQLTIPVRNHNSSIVDDEPNAVQLLEDHKQGAVPATATEMLLRCTEALEFLKHTGRPYF